MLLSLLKMSIIYSWVLTPILVDIKIGSILASLTINRKRDQLKSTSATWKENFQWSNMGKGYTKDHKVNNGSSFLKWQ